MLLSLLSRRSLEVDSRDAYGFALRPQHTHRYREYANIYKEEEGERSENWNNFLNQVVESSQKFHIEKEVVDESKSGVSGQQADAFSEIYEEAKEDESIEKKSVCGEPTEEDPEEKLQFSKDTKACKLQTWTQVRPSLSVIENMMASRVKKRKSIKDELAIAIGNHLPPLDEGGPTLSSSDEDIEIQGPTNGLSSNNVDASWAEGDASDVSFKNKNVSSMENVTYDGDLQEKKFPWKEELKSLVRGGLPKDLRGEIWQAFVGVKARRVESYYQDLLAQDTQSENDEDNNLSGVPKKWKKQIEKDIPRTFPGHPALNENGRNSLRRILFAYALHNPSVGYCQAMNFFAGILLLLMPEENAFWTLVGIIDDYFDGYYTEDMVESQVDQLVLEELMRERFPKLVNHLDYLGVQVAWISGPWFLSIFVNMLPWESVLRVWDVLLFEGNRVMLFRTAFALMELYGPTLVTTKDAGDAITLLQSLAGSTFDSSQLVLTACMGFLAISESRLQVLRENHRPSVLAVIEERTKRGRIWKDSKGLASKLYSFKHDPGPLVESKKVSEEDKELADENETYLGCDSSNLDDLLNGLAVDSELDSLPDLKEQVVWLKVELCRLLAEKRSAVLRSEELETALMEMVKQDNRRQLSARVEQLETEVSELQQIIADKREQETAILQILMRVEQEQKVTEDARIRAEQDVAAQKYAVHVLQEKYEKAMTSIVEMEKRVVMAESMLEATLHYESGQVKKAPSSPRSMQNQGSAQGSSSKKTGLLAFGLGWRDRNKGKPTSSEEFVGYRTSNDNTEPSSMSQ